MTHRRTSAIAQARTSNALAMHNPAQGTQNELIEALREQIESLKAQVVREQEQANHWRNQATMFLTHQPEPPKAEQPTRSRLYEKLFGRRSV